MPAPEPMNDSRRAYPAGVVLLALFYFFAGLNHFRVSEVYLPMMPDYLPFHLELVLLSGFFEVLLGLLVLPKQTRAAAGLGIIALLVAVFPANIHIALHAEDFPIIPPFLLWLRLPAQGLLILWAYFSTADAKLND